MKHEDNLVSVVVPVYNADQYIEQTIESVIRQTYTNWELILVDDGSTDHSVKLIKKYTDNTKIFLLQHPEGVNKGVSKTRELGVKAAQGKYVAFLDADDVFFPEKLSEQLKVFFELQNVVLVHSKVELIKEGDSSYNNNFMIGAEDKIYKLHEQDNWLKSNAICNSTVMVRSSLLKHTSFGLPQLFQYEDWLLWSLLSQKGYFYYQNTPQTKYRIHPGSATTATLKNRLMIPYSKIEYLVSLYLLNEESNFNCGIVEALKEVLIELLAGYSNPGHDKINEFRNDIFNNSDVGKGYFEKYSKLEHNYRELQKKYKDLEKNHSVVYKLLNKIRRTFNTL